jgi:hypothetical protein
MTARARYTTEPMYPSPARSIVEPAPTAAPAARANVPSRTTSDPPARLLDTIKTLGSLLDDLEAVRVANGNRIGALEREYGEALPHLEVVQKQIRAAEHLAELELVRAWRKHPLARWAKEFKGVGEKSIARLVAIVGEPGERANVAKLWAYCGHGDPSRRRRKGMTQEELFRLGNPAAKKQTWLIACALLKAGNREWYDEARGRYADRLHEARCVRCGPAGAPAEPGSPWSAAHQHAAALRFVGKQFLKELWVASRAIAVPENQMTTAREVAR